MDVPAGILILVMCGVVIAATTTWALRNDFEERGVARCWALVEAFGIQVLLLTTLTAVTLQVSIRYFLADKVAVTWTEELALLGLVWGAFWGAAAVHRSQEHINLTLLYDLLPPRLQQALLIFGDLAIIAVCVPIAWFGFDNARWLDIMATVSLGLPLSVFAYSIPVCATLLIVHSATHLIQRLGALFRSSTRAREGAL